MEAAQIVARAREHGIIGAGGAGFPAHVKLGAHVEVVIGNGAECEPLLRVDQQLMVHFAAEVVRGLVLAREATGASRAILALKRKYHAAIKALTGPAESEGVELFLLDNFYPAGDEITLIREVIDRGVPAGNIPLAARVVVSNVGTLLNLARACDANEPVTQRWVTVTGAVPEPGTFSAPVGTPVRELIKHAGGALPKKWVYLAGGPMMGTVQEDSSHPVAKTDSGIIVLPDDHYLVVKKQLPWQRMAKKARSACVQCVACTDVCPRYLLGHNIRPHMIMRQVGYGMELKPETLESVFLCCECGACTYFACPMDLSPGAINAQLKRKIIDQGGRGPSSDAVPEPSDLRPLRKIPVKRLIARLHLGDYDRPAPLVKKPLPVNAVTIPLQQHIGAPASPVVAVGDAVTAGQVIGDIPADKLGARVHASITGSVTAVTAAHIAIER